MFASPFIGQNFETKAFRAILEALNILEQQAEVTVSVTVTPRALQSAWRRIPPDADLTCYRPTPPSQVDLVIHAIDLNVDRRLSIEEIKNFLFPSPHPDYVGAFRSRSGSVCHENYAMRCDVM